MITDSEINQRPSDITHLYDSCSISWSASIQSLGMLAMISRHSVKDCNTKRNCVPWSCDRQAPPPENDEEYPL